MVQGSSNLESVGFVTPDNKIVVVVMNTGDQVAKFKLKDVVHGKAASIVALPHSIQTFSYNFDPKVKHF